MSIRNIGTEPSTTIKSSWNTSKIPSSSSTLLWTTLSIKPSRNSKRNSKTTNNFISRPSLQSPKRFKHFLPWNNNSVPGSSISGSGLLSSVTSTPKTSKTIKSWPALITMAGNPPKPKLPNAPKSTSTTLHTVDLLKKLILWTPAIQKCTWLTTKCTRKALSQTEGRLLRPRSINLSMPLLSKKVTSKRGNEMKLRTGKKPGKDLGRYPGRRKSRYLCLMSFLSMLTL